MSDCAKHNGSELPAGESCCRVPNRATVPGVEKQFRYVRTRSAQGVIARHLHLSKVLTLRPISYIKISEAILRIRALHLSDLHFNVKKNDHDQGEVLAALCRDIAERARPSEEKAIDLVFFTGDLIGRGNYSDDYQEKISSAFIDPLIVATNLSKEKIILCPGNHDVELSVRDEIYEAGLKVNLSTKNELNQFIDKHEKKVSAFQDIEKYNEYAKQFASSSRVKHTPLFSSFRFAFRGVEVGIAALNSAWRATGRPNDADCGSLLLGERQVELAAETIKDCKVKIALMHHPLNWLAARDYQHVQRAIARNFDVLLHGHVHETEGVSLVAPHNNLIVCGAGCLYQSREYFNGYSIIDIDLQTNTFKQEAREYYSARNCFDQTARYNNNGIFESNFRGDSSTIFALPEKSVARISEAINGQLVSSSISDIAPEDIDDLFVEPRLSGEATNQLAVDANASNGSAEASQFVSLPELQIQPGNYFIWGSSESGKTTLLNYLALRVIRTTALTGNIAFVIDGKTTATVDLAIKAMVAFCDGAFKRLEIERALETGRAVVFIDNCAVEPSTPEYSGLVKLVSTFDRCKFVFCAKDELRLTLVNNQLPDIGAPVKQLFLQPFTRKQVRTLIQKWFGHEEEHCAQLVDEVLRVTRTLGVPRSPFLMSMIIWLNEKNIKFSPVNYATLIEGFIEGLLEKLSDTNFRSESYTFRTKQHFLCELAAKMSESPLKEISVLGLQQFAVEYFQSRPQPNAKPLELLEHFFRRGILLEIGDIVRFKLECFREYFVAKRMLEDADYRATCMAPERILDFASEIDYYSALKQDDLALLQISKKQLEKTYASSRLEIASSDYIRIASHDTSILEQMKERMGELIHQKPNSEERERMLDELDEARIGAPIGQLEEAEATSSDESEEDPTVYYDEKYAEYLRSLFLASRVLRNSELVGDSNVVREMFASCMEHWAKNIMFALAQMEILGDEHGHLHTDDGERIPEEALQFVKTMLPLFFLEMVKDTIGTAKLADVMTQYIRDPANTELTVLIATMLYAELGLPKYLDRLEDFVKRSNLVAGSREAVLIKMWTLYVYKRLSPPEQERLEGLMSELFKAVSDGSAPITKAERGAYVRSIRDQVNRIRLISPDAVRDS